MAAFAAAIDLGFRYVETDVHATRDGVLVAFHDEGLKRLSGRPEAIADLAWRSIPSMTRPLCRSSTFFSGRMPSAVFVSDHSLGAA